MNISKTANWLLYLHSHQLYNRDDWDRLIIWFSLHITDTITI